ncbi:MAG TPA: hypothetical protein VIS49_13585 [Cyclobacteriaceae bacterium]
MTVLLFSIGFIALFFVLMSVRLLFLKGGEFRGTCASQSPWLVKEGTTCGYCGKTLSAGEACPSPEQQATEFPEVDRKK